jgi:hypothetical protein
VTLPVRRRQPRRFLVADFKVMNRNLMVGGAFPSTCLDVVGATAGGLRETKRLDS